MKQHRRVFLKTLAAVAGSASFLFLPSNGKPKSTQQYSVGERGPEMFIPNAPNRIITIRVQNKRAFATPNSQLWQGGDLWRKDKAKEWRKV